MGRSRYKILDNELPHFLTCTVIDWLPLFSQTALAEIIFDSLTFLQREKRIVLYAYVIMENHLHLVASSNNLSKEIGDFKSFTARSILDYLQENNSYPLLGSWPPQNLHIKQTDGISFGKKAVTHRRSRMEKY